jgi:hypothetical protein
MSGLNKISGCVLVMILLSLPCFAQGGGGNRRGGGAPPPAGPAQRRPGPHFGDWLRKNMNTPPAQQKQELEKSDEFKKLPPDKQQQLLNRLNRFNSMSPVQKDRVLSHMEWLEHLSPDQKKKASDLHGQFRQLSPDRRQELRRALFNMRDMTPDERQKNIESPQMKQNFSDQERQIMKGYTDLGFPDQHAEDDGGGSPQEQM